MWSKQRITTTLMKPAGFTEPDPDTVTVDGSDVTRLNPGKPDHLLRRGRDLVEEVAYDSEAPDDRRSPDSHPTRLFHAAPFEKDR
jgi:hypothetical protein